MPVMESGNAMGIRNTGKSKLKSVRQIAVIKRIKETGFFKIILLR
jgi:hypothetical protein